MPLFSHVSSSNSVGGKAEMSVFGIALPRSGAKSEIYKQSWRRAGLWCSPLGEAKLPLPIGDGDPRLAGTAEGRAQGSPRAGRATGKRHFP